jgi:hypothetical protein
MVGMRLTVTRPTAVTLLVSVLLAGAASVAASAGAADASSTVVVCASPLGGALSLRSGQKCPQLFQELSLGVTGPAGAQGQTGATGPRGATGQAGATGAQGPKGATGQTGAAGQTGATGAKGSTGETGSTGLRGLQGATGPTGSQGETGATGARGEAGTSGSAGAAGLAGLRGESGPRGETGEAGATGPQGSQGEAGPNGESGVTGATGATGAAGVSAIDSLPAGQTERGVLTGQEVASEEEQEFLAEATLPVPAPVPVIAKDVVVAGGVAGPTGESTDKAGGACKGNAAAPTAPPGLVCLYPTIQGNLLRAPEGWEILAGKAPTGSASGGAGAGKVTILGTRYGFGVRYISAEPGITTVSYIWAYTAPGAEPEEEAEEGEESEPAPPIGGWNKVTNNPTGEVGVG